MTTLDNQLSDAIDRRDYITASQLAEQCGYTEVVRDLAMYRAAQELREAFRSIAESMMAALSEVGKTYRAIDPALKALWGDHRSTPNMRKKIARAIRRMKQ